MHTQREMGRAFSVDEVSDQFWSERPRLPKPGEPHMMSRSESVWEFQRFLQEQASPEAKEAAAAGNPSAEGGGDDNDVVEIKDPSPDRNEEPSQDRTSGNNVSGDANSNNRHRGKTTTNPLAFNAGGENIPIDSEEYQAFLKSKLNLACAAVALSRASYVMPQESLAKSEGSQASKSAQPVSQGPAKGGLHDISKSQDKDVGGFPLGIPSLSATQKKAGIPMSSTTSGSSREQSDDDEAKGETATTANIDPADAKRIRRMLSNRESARQSRRRKQAHLTDLEMQVAQLGVENSSLLKRLADVSQKYNQAAVDNRVLKADVETLRAKVKMAEETVKRLTGLNPMVHMMSEMSSIGVPPCDGSPSDASIDAAVPGPNEQKNQFYQADSGNLASSSHDPGFNNNMADIKNSLQHVASTNKMGRTASMQRVASLENLQKRIRGDSSPRGTNSMETSRILVQL